MRVIHSSGRHGDSGASAVEYGLLVAAIAAAVVLVVFLLGGVVTEVFQNTCDEIQAEAETAANCVAP